MELKCEDYYFYPNGDSKWDSQLYSFDNDCHQISTAVRIFGTQNQIDAAFKDICTLTKLNLDECYTYEIEKKGSFHYNKEQNKVIAKKLEQYKEAYTGVISDEPDELIHKRMNDINTFQAHENEVYLRGTDEYGKDFQICFDSYNFLEWINTEHLKYIKKQLIKYIKTK